MKAKTLPNAASLIALLVFAVSQAAFAAAPTATTQAASLIASTSAQLNGYVNPNGLSTTVYWQYGLTTGYGSATTSGNVGTTVMNVGTTASGLTPNTTYHFRFVAYNSGGTTYGGDLTFTTSGQAPTATTQAADSITSTSAHLNSYVNPNGASTTIYFQYGLTTGYGSATIQGSIGTSVGNFGSTISGLSPNTTYHFRIVAYNTGGTSYGSDLTFTTSGQAPAVTTQAADSITSTSAHLNSYVNPNGASTTIYFQYGLTTGYGSATIQGSIGTSVGNFGSTISGLSPNTTYHFRIVAYNSGGTTYGTDLTFPTGAQQAPTATTQAASLITTTSAQLNGYVNPNGASTTVYWQYGLTTSYGSTTISGNVGTTVESIGTTVSGLTPNTTYHFRFVAYNSGGTTYGTDLTFPTSGQAPTATTQAASSVAATSATLNGYINPNGASTTAYFEYGLTTSYGSTTTQGNFGTSPQNISYGISSLTANTTYHFRIVAYNSGGTTHGSDLTFTTSTQAPTVQTLAAAAVTTTSAQLNGSINPNGLTTTAYFEYGTTTSYGTTTPSGNFGTVAQNIGFTVSGLAPNTIYHYRIVASNSNGTSRGGDMTLNTTGTSAPSVQTLAATAVSTTAAQLNGFVIPNGFSTTASFQYGLTAAYGSTTPSGNFGTTPQNIGYSITGLSPSTTYHYRIVAYNSAGTSYGLDSSFITASAPGSTPPTIVTQPQSQTAHTGVNITFTVVATGTAPLVYQWLKNGATLSGKTTSTLTLNSVGTSDSDGYSVAVSNARGTATSAAAWLAVYATPPPTPPPAPVVVATDRPPENPNLVPVTDTQLKVYSGGVFVTGGTVDLSKMTVVFSHGWNSNPDAWARSMASTMAANGVANANLMAWDWRDAANTGIVLSRAFCAAPSQGHKLGHALATVLGTSYGKPIHFVGHSLGTLVNASAANYLHEQTGNAFDYSKTHVTLFDDAEAANIEGKIFWGGYLTTGLESLMGLGDAPTLGWVSPMPNHSGWADNYMSIAGGLHQGAVNVLLNQAADFANSSDWSSYYSAAHGYALNWYSNTIGQTDISILGNRYSFERLGFNSPPAQACPYSLGTKFVQDAYPANQFNLHQPSQAEYNQIVNRLFGRLALYGAVNTLAGVGQTIGDAYLDVITSAAPVISGTASTLTSDFFYSFRAILNSATGSQSQMVSRGGVSPHDTGSGTQPPCVWLPIVVPTNALVLSFDFTFTGSAGDDVLASSIDGTNLFALEAQFIPQGQKLNSGSIPVANWAGKTVELFFGLVGGTSSNATVTIDAMRFYQLAPPAISIAVSGSQVVVSWPATDQAFALQSATSLAGANSWTTITNVPTLIGFSYQVTNSLSGSARFYRLKK